jgi:hypothetical protein
VDERVIISKLSNIFDGKDKNLRKINKNEKRVIFISPRCYLILRAIKKNRGLHWRCGGRKAAPVGVEATLINIPRRVNKMSSVGLIETT